MPKGKGWTEERRKAQAERCRQNRPWEHATGPKTVAGKARSSMNALKYVHNDALKHVARALIHHNRGFLEAEKLFHAIKLNEVFEKERIISRQKEKLKKEVKKK